MRATPFSAAEIKQQSAEISGRVLNLARDLDAVVWSVNPGNDSLGELFAYLGQSFLECFRRTAIRPRLEVMETVPDSALAPEVRHHLFLVVKEAMNNVIKHSQATEVTLTPEGGCKHLGDSDCRQRPGVFSRCHRPIQAPRLSEYAGACRAIGRKARSIQRTGQRHRDSCFDFVLAGFARRAAPH